MEDEVSTPGEGSEGSPEVPPLPDLPPAIAANADELRRLIDAGAASPEELRQLAAKLREHRALEESLWRAEVKPALRQAKKGRFDLGYLREPSDARPGGGGNGLKLGLSVLGAVAVLVLAATQSSFLWILVPVVAVLVYAFRQGRNATSEAEPSPPSEGPPA